MSVALKVPCVDGATRLTLLVDVAAHPSGVAGLVVHRELVWVRDEQWWKPSAKFWALTHEPSGRQVSFGFRGVKEAAAFAKAVVHLCDWTRSWEQLDSRELSRSLIQARWAGTTRLVAGI
jgi:hypothetical protein